MEPAAPLVAQVLGKFELGAPSVSTFVLHGTLPVPQGTYPRADGLQPFGVISGNGQTVPAQCEIVSRFPNDTKGADVVEILARVSLPPGTQPGTRVTYSIVDFPHAATTMNPTPAVAGILNTPGAVTLRSRDVFSNEYRADLLRGQDGSEVLRMGSAAFQTRFYETMRATGGNVGPPTGALPHFLNAHSYVTEWFGEDMLSLDLRVHNAPSGKDQNSSLDNPLENVYFDNLELWVPNGWTVLVDWRDPMLGTPRQEPGFTVLPLVKDNPDGTMHMMPSQAQLQRRMVLVKQGVQARGVSLLGEEWLGFCRHGRNAQGVELYSWWNPATAYYFPQRHRLPELDYLGLPTIRAKLTIDLDRISDCLVRGTANGGAITTPNLGWAHPWGVKYGGMTSGTEIYLYDGMQTAAAASADGYRLAQMALRMYAERNPTSLYNRDGNPTQHTEWITHGAQFDYIYMQFYLRLLPGPDPFGFDQAPTYQQSYVNSNGLAPAYESELLGFKPIDIQHQVRITRSMKVLTWLGNDAMAKDDLRMHAEIIRLSYHDLHSSPGGGIMGTGMLVDLQDVGTHSGVGFDFGRGEGWSVDTMCAAYSINPVAWRQQARAWFDDIVTMVRDGQATCTGTIQRNHSNKLLDGLYYGRQSIEQAIIENALWGMMQSVYRGVSPTTTATLRTVIAKSAYSMVQFPAWDDPKKGPWAQLAVAPLRGLALPYCNLIPPLGTSAGVDKFQVWSSFAYGYELTGDQIFLDKALMMAGGSHLLTTLQNSNYTNMENRSALIALMQTLP